jgi:hypothetical protein
MHYIWTTETDSDSAEVRSSYYRPCFLKLEAVWPV